MRAPILLMLGLALLGGTRLAKPQTGRRKLEQPAIGGVTLDALLDRLEENIADYKRSVPNLYCTESAQSDRKIGGQSSSPDVATPNGPIPSERVPVKEVRLRTEATFRLKRTTEPGTPGVFDESRVVHSVNGKPVGKDAAMAAAPATLYGVFSNGLNILSKEGRACFVFRLRDAGKDKKSGDKRIEVDFADLPKRERGSECAPFENTSGRIFVDRQSMHVVRIEKQVPHRELVPGVFGMWNWTEEYAPVSLLDRTFWMTKSISSTSRSEDENYLWTFDAKYSDYHLFHAEVRIVP